MTPAEKRAAGMGAIGYVRVSTHEQTEGWSLARQEAEIRAWAHQYDIRLIDVVTAPDGWESGKDFERIGWQAVERHIAQGTVGWIVVAAIDRLSRNLQQLAEHMRTWEDQNIAVVAPGMGHHDPAGLGRFLLHLHGLFAEHERQRLIGRVIPGMKARLAAGLPLGRLPLGYRLVSDSRDGHQKPRTRLVPEAATAPVVQALFAEALRSPEHGDRRMAAWAAERWPTLSWSPGRVAGILTNLIYTGLLDASVGTEAIVKPDNHPGLIDLVDFARLQVIRQQRAADRDRGLNAVRATSWLGGIVKCGRCGGAVTWRENSLSPPHPTPATGTGQYECRGAAGQHGCGSVWAREIEAFVQRAIEKLLEQDVGQLHAIAADALHRLPAHLDERRARAEADLASITTNEARFTNDLAEGRLSGAAYTTAVETFEARRSAATSLLTEIDGWTYLSRLVVIRDGAAPGTLRWVTLQEAIGRLTLPERRRLLHALSPTITLADLDTMGPLGGAGEDPVHGVFTGVSFARPKLEGVSSVIALGMARLLVTEPGHDVARGLAVSGWSPTGGPAKPVWTGPHDSQTNGALPQTIRFVTDSVDPS